MIPATDGNDENVLLSLLKSLSVVFIYWAVAFCSFVAFTFPAAERNFADAHLFVFTLKKFPSEKTHDNETLLRHYPTEKESPIHRWKIVARDTTLLAKQDE